MKKNKIMLPITLCLLLSLTATELFARGQKDKGAKTITVSATGTASAAPNVIILSFGVQSMGKEISMAINDNKTRMNSILEVLAQYGIPAGDYETTGFSVYFQRSNYKQGSDPLEGFYHVNNSLTVDFKKLEEIGKFIDAVLDAGANHFNGLQYAIKDTAPLEKKAREGAVKNALALAEELAAAAGKEVVDILNITDGIYHPPGPFGMKRMMGAADGGNSVIVPPNEKMVTQQVQLTVQIR